MTVEFQPDSWSRSGRAIHDESANFLHSAQSRLGRMTPTALGCEGNGTLMDAAFSIIFPVAVEALQETATGLAGGFAQVTDAMNEARDAYIGVERMNEEQARSAGVI